MATSLPHSDAPFIVFSDFDGTITTEDSNDHMTDNLGFGLAKRRVLNEDILENRKNFRDAFREMLASVSEKYSFAECREVVKKNIKLDPGFKDFFEWAKAANVPVVIVSSGMEPIIRAILENLIGSEDAAKIDIISNFVDLGSDGKGEKGNWGIKYRHPESGFGHDKSRATAPYRSLPNPPTLFFCGDGVSDLSAARAADVLFVKVIPNHPNDLSKHCDREGIPYTPFDSFLKVRDEVKAVVEGTKAAADVNK